MQKCFLAALRRDTPLPSDLEKGLRDVGEYVVISRAGPLSVLMLRCPNLCMLILLCYSQSPKASHNKAGRSDFEVSDSNPGKMLGLRERRVDLAWIFPFENRFTESTISGLCHWKFLARNVKLASLGLLTCEYGHPIAAT